MTVPPANPEDPQPSDAELIVILNAGGRSAEKAFEILYRRYRDWTVSLALRFLGDRDLALDVMQETFLYVLKKFPGFQLTSQFKSFLYPAVRHLSLHAAQKARRTLSWDDNALNAQPAAPTSPSGSPDLTAVLAQLPVAQREVLLLRFVDDLPLQDIALALGVPLGTVKSRLHHALAALRADPRTRALLEP